MLLYIYFLCTLAQIKKNLNFASDLKVLIVAYLPDNGTMLRWKLY